MNDLIKALGIVSAIATFYAIADGERAKRQAAIDKEINRQRMLELKLEIRQVRELLEGRA